MKRLMREYLASLGERSDLEILLPDMISEIGMSVISRPGRGSRQYGVDVLASGPDPRNPEETAAYLITIKSGNIGRADWTGSVQAVRPSVEEIVDVYIPNQLPPALRDKTKVIVICCGGDILENIRQNVSSYTMNLQTKNPDIVVQEWTGDHLADVIMSGLLREAVFSDTLKSDLRKAIAFVDEAEVCERHIERLSRNLLSQELDDNSRRLTALRQINLAIYSVFVWAHKEGSLDSAYRGSEAALLAAWQIARVVMGDKSVGARRVMAAFTNVANLHLNILEHYTAEHVEPSVGILDGLASQVPSGAAVDINLKLFDVLGRLALLGHWKFQESIRRHIAGFEVANAEERQELARIADMLESLIKNNPALNSPISDHQAVPITLAHTFLTAVRRDNFVQHWLSQISIACDFAWKSRSGYPISSDVYSDLAAHTRGADSKSDQEHNRLTNANTLYGMLLVDAARRGDNENFAFLRQIIDGSMAHSTSQFWFPNDASEEHLYMNTHVHGRALTEIPSGETPEAFLAELNSVLSAESGTAKLSAVRATFWTVALVALRRYGLPVPITFQATLIGAIARVNEDLDATNKQ